MQTADYPAAIYLSLPLPTIRNTLWPLEIPLPPSFYIILYSSTALRRHTLPPPRLIASVLEGIKGYIIYCGREETQSLLNSLKVTAPTLWTVYTRDTAGPVTVLYDIFFSSILPAPLKFVIM